MVGVRCVFIVGLQFVKQGALPREIASGRTATFTLDLAPPTGGWQHGGRPRAECASALGESRWRARLKGETLSPADDVSDYHIEAALREKDSGPLEIIRIVPVQPCQVSSARNSSRRLQIWAQGTSSGRRPLAAATAAATPATSPIATALPVTR